MYQFSVSLRCFTLAGGASQCARMKQTIENQEPPGAVLLFIYRGQIVFEEAYGYADRGNTKRLPRTDDIFNLASTSRREATTVAMTLLNTGKIGLLAEVRFTSEAIFFKTSRN